MQADGPVFAGLRLRDDVQLVRSPTDVFPLEPEGLADPQPLETERQRDRLHVRRIGREQAVLLLDRQELDALVPVLWPLQPRGHKPLLISSIVQGGMQDGPEPVDSRWLEVGAPRLGRGRAWSGRRRLR